MEPYKSEHISFLSSGAVRPLYKMIDIILIYVKILTGELVPLSALVVPTITTPISTLLEMNALKIWVVTGGGLHTLVYWHQKICVEWQY